MEYREGRVGRFFVVKFSDGDDPLAAIREIAVEKNIRTAWFFLLGGLRQAGMVTGPEEPVIPPVAAWEEISNDAREILGIGTVLWNSEAPVIHLHAAAGRRDKVHIGCIRRDARVFLVVECLLIEIEGIDMCRELDELSGLQLASFK